MEKAFTMIELIFIIIIIGILGSIALPKLTSTRSDAKGTKIVHALAQCINEAGGVFMMNGSFRHTTQDNNMSNNCRIADECFDFIEYDNNGSLTVINDNSEDSKMCQEAQRIANENLLSASHVINF